MTVQSELQALYDRYVAAYRVGDARGCAAVFHREGHLYSPYGPPAQGRTAIRALHADWVAEGGEGKRITVLHSGHDGDMAWCLAAFSEGDAASDGVSLNVLERQPSGGWLIRMCSLTAVS